MKALYIGHYSEGSTSRMRGEILQKILPAETLFRVCDIDIPVKATPRLYRSLGWRWYKGPLITAINKYILPVIETTEGFDIAWIDKGVFIQPSVLAKLRAKTNTLIHYTPDTAFSYNRSALFFEGIHLYDYCITTKSFETAAYHEQGAKRILFCTQGYNPAVHHSYHEFSEKKGVCFVGLYEPWRAACIQSLLKNGLSVKLAGHGWNSFVKKNRRFSQLSYYGEGLFADAYAKLISGSLVGLGFLSKKFPELHTTRTFEIPACGTLLASEKNIEIESFFDPGEVLFFNDPVELGNAIVQLMNDLPRLHEMGAAGMKRVINNKADYMSIMKTLLMKMGLL